MATFWDKDEPLFGGPKDKDTYNKRWNRYTEDFKSAMNNNWHLNPNYQPWEKKPYNQDKHWKPAYKRQFCELFFTHDGKDIIIRDHYDEDVILPAEIIHKAMATVSKTEIANLALLANHLKAKMLGKYVMEYCIKEALICHPVEEILFDNPFKHEYV